MISKPPPGGFFVPLQPDSQFLIQTKCRLASGLRQSIIIRLNEADDLRIRRHVTHSTRGGFDPFSKVTLPVSSVER
jgi:hypothetical protein